MTPRSLKGTLRSVNTMRDANNPLRGLSMPRAVAMAEAAQRGVMADLQWLYAAPETGLETTDSDLMAIIERTMSGVSTIGWDIQRAEPDTNGYDEALCNEQAAFLREAYTLCDNLDDAIEHLAMARFRGFAHLQPWIRGDWAIEHLEPLPQHNMIRDGSLGGWAWDPTARAVSYNSTPSENRLSPEDYIVLVSRRPVNRIALIKYVRASVAEKDWDFYVETYGLPGAFVIMPPDIPEGKEEEYEATALAASEGGSGALPHGSDVKSLTEARSSQPFRPRLEWLQQQLVLAGTGGLLTMLAESGSGTLAGGAHSKTWEAIIHRLAYLISRPLKRQYEIPALRARFGNRPILAWMELKAATETNSSEAAKNIAALAGAGYVVDIKEVKEATGYTVTRAEPQAAGVQESGSSGVRNATMSATAAAQTDAEREAVEEIVARMTEAILGAEEKQAAEMADAMAKATLEAKDAGQKTASNLTTPPSGHPSAGGESKSRCKAVAKSILTPCGVKDGCTAGLEEQIDSRGVSGGSAIFKASAGECQSDNPAACRRHGSRGNRETGTKKTAHDRYGNTDEARLAAEPKLNAARGKAALEDCIRNKKDVGKAV